MIDTRAQVSDSHHTSALAIPTFRRYLSSSCASTMATWLLRFLLGWQAWDLTQSAFWVGIASVLMLLPSFFLAPVFGVVSDRVNPHSGLLSTLALQGAVAALAALLDWLGVFNFGWLLFLAGLIGVVVAAHQPMRLALMPKVVTRDALPNAVGWSAMVFNSSRILGPALGGWLLLQWGASSTYGAAALLFLFAGIMLLRVKGIAGPAPTSQQASVFSALTAGLSFVKHQRMLQFAFMFTLINGLLGRSVIELLPALSGKLLQGGAGTLALLSATAGGGSVLGGLLIARQASNAQGLIRLVAGYLLACVAAIVPVFLVKGVFGLCVVVGCLSLATTMVGTGCQTIAQLQVTDDLRGRVMSLWVVLTMASPAVGTFLMGAMADWLGFVPTLLVFAGLASVAVVWVWLARMGKTALAS